MKATENTNPRCLVLCVNYDSTSETQRYLSGIRRQRHEELIDVIVIDNSPGLDERLSQTVNGFAWTWLVRPGRNAGYFGGAAHGLSWYLDRHASPEWVIVSNVDLVFEDDSFFDVLLRHALPEAAVIAPSIISNVTGSDQNPFLKERPQRWELSVKRLLLSSRITFGAWQFLNRVRYDARFSRLGTAGETGTARDIYAPHGAFVILHRTYFESGGTLDHPLPLYGEEVFVAETARRLGLRVRYEPSLRVLHDEHVSTASLSNKAAVLKDCTTHVMESYYP